MGLAEYTFHCAATGEFYKESRQAQENAMLAYGVLAREGWTFQAFLGFWANVGHEGGYNPWRWQGDYVLPKDSSLIGYPGGPNTGHAYGFVQWDPAGKYIYGGGRDYDSFGPNYSDEVGNVNDGWAQLLFLNDNADYIAVYPWSNPMTYAQYKRSTDDPRVLVEVWLRNFERPGTFDLEGRKATATWWWNWFTSGAPIGPDQPTPPPPYVPPTPPTPGSLSKSKFIFYLKPYWKRGL